jgi:hypothetical protein
VYAVTLLLVLTAVVPGVAFAQQDSSESGDGGDTVVNIDLDEVVEAIEELVQELTEFTGEWDTVLKEVLRAVLFKPFQFLAQQLIQILILLLTTTPTIYPNPAVEEVHRISLVVAYSLSGLVFAVAGLLHIIGPVLGVSYRKVRMILPRVFVALVFASISLPLLQYTVRLSDALVHVFQPSGLTTTLPQLAGLSVSLVLVWVIEASLLLVLVVMFIIRNVYLLFAAAISPLLALGWSLPGVKRYADTFISGYWTAWAMAPLDGLVLRFILAMLDGTNVSGVQGLSNWILGIAGFTLLIFVPYQLYGASQAAIGQSYLIARGVKNRVNQYRNKSKSQSSRRRIPRRSKRDRDRDSVNYRGGDDD